MTKLPAFQKHMEELRHGSRMFQDGQFQPDGFQLVVHPERLLPDFPRLEGLDRFVAAGGFGSGELRYVLRTEFAPKTAAGDEPRMHRAFLGQPSLGDFARLVPKGAEFFEVTSGSKVAESAELFLTMVAWFLPMGESVVRGWQTGVGEWFGHLRDAFLTRLTGRRALVQTKEGTILAWEIATPVEEAAKEWGLVLQEMEGSLSALGKVEPVTLATPQESMPTEHLRQIVLAGSGADGVGRSRVLLGVVGDVFVISTSEQAIERVLAVRAGKIPTVGENETFRRQWTLPEGDLPAEHLQAVGYGDLQSALGWLRVVVDSAPTLERLRVLQAPLAAAIGRSGSVLDALDFLGLRVSHTVRDGDSLMSAGKVSLKLGGRRF